MIPERAEFFRKDFVMQRKLFCSTCKEITMHQIQVLKDSPDDGGVPCLKTCHDCYRAYQKLLELDIDKGNPVLFQRFLTLPYEFLVMHEHYLE